MTNKNIDISPQHLALVLKILHKHLKPNTQVWVFGSRAIGNARKNSDLDIAIESNNQSLPIEVLSALVEDFDESSLPYKVDILDWLNIDDSFRSHIEHDRILLTKT